MDRVYVTNQFGESFDKATYERSIIPLMDVEIREHLCCQGITDPQKFFEMHSALYLRKHKEPWELDTKNPQI